VNHRRWRFATINSVGTLTLVVFLTLAAALTAWRALEPTAEVKSVSSSWTGIIVGYARVIDGDTLELSGTKIRLDGIDAPESMQTCVINAQAYRCGERAMQALVDLVKGHTVRCEPTGMDRYRRTIARCRTDESGVNINSWLVSEGLAVAYRRYSREYIPEEYLARIAGRGLWAGTFQMPWEFRAERRNDHGRTSHSRGPY
jgi:endonuclease YncB( thermonuclease family)